MDPFELEEESIDIFRFAPHVRGTQGEWHDKIIQNTDLTKYKLYKNTTRSIWALKTDIFWFKSPLVELAGPETGFEFIDLLLRRVYVTPRMDRGRGLERLNSIYDFTQPQPHVMDGVKHEEKGTYLGNFGRKNADYQDFCHPPALSSHAWLLSMNSINIMRRKYPSCPSRDKHIFTQN